MGLRGSTVGADTVSYIRFFELYKDTNFSKLFSVSYMEPGYTLLMKFCSIICGDYVFFQVLISFVFCYGMAKFVFDNSKHVVLTTIIFLGIGFYATAFNLTRQAIAVMLVANAWTFLLQEKRIRSLILILIASTIHTSALVILIAYVIYIFRRNRTFLIILLVIAVIIAINYKVVIDFISTYLVRYDSYYENNMGTMSAGFVRILWAIILLFSIIMIFKKDVSTNSRMISVLSVIYVLCNFIALFFNYFERVGLYFVPFAILLFEDFGDEIVGVNMKNINIKIINNNRISTKHLYFVGVSVCFIIFFLISVISSKQYAYIPFWVG